MHTYSLPISNKFEQLFRKWSFYLKIYYITITILMMLFSFARSLAYTTSENLHMKWCNESIRDFDHRNIAMGIGMCVLLTESMFEHFLFCWSQRNITLCNAYCENWTRIDNVGKFSNETEREKRKQYTQRTNGIHSTLNNWIILYIFTMIWSRILFANITTMHNLFWIVSTLWKLNRIQNCVCMFALFFSLCTLIFSADFQDSVHLSLSLYLSCSSLWIKHWLFDI